MDTNKMREQFEEKFPTPIGMAWCDVAQQYVKALGCICPPTAITAYNQLWKCWQASREAVVVELPELRSVPDRDCWARTNGLGFNNALKEARQVIEAQGLKVTP